MSSFLKLKFHLFFFFPQMTMMVYKIIVELYIMWGPCRINLYNGALGINTTCQNHRWSILWTHTKCHAFHVTDNNTPTLSENHTCAPLQPTGKTSSAIGPSRKRRQNIISQKYIKYKSKWLHLGSWHGVFRCSLIYNVPKIINFLYHSYYSSYLYKSIFNPQ